VALDVLINALHQLRTRTSSEIAELGDAGGPLAKRRTGPWRNRPTALFPLG